MYQKIRNLIFTVSKNSRVSTKELGKAMHTSQQSASYLLKQLEKKKTMRYTAVVDAVKLGFTNVLVGVDYVNFEPEQKNMVIEMLKNTPTIISIKEGGVGVDLLIEYSAPNLSAFNKTHTEIMQKLKVETRFVFPIIVKHKFTKKYLVRKEDLKDLILCGDRKIQLLTIREWKVLRALVERPEATLTSLAQETKISIKTLVSVKKKLEQRNVIKGYSAVFNHVEINQYLLFLKLRYIDRLVQYSKSNKNIIEATKVIGTYDLVLTVEELKKTQVLQDIRNNFSIEEYFVVEVNQTIKETYLPLIHPE